MDGPDDDDDTPTRETKEGKKKLFAAPAMFSPSDLTDGGRPACDIGGGSIWVVANETRALEQQRRRLLLLHLSLGEIRSSSSLTIGSIIGRDGGCAGAAIFTAIPSPFFS